MKQVVSVISHFLLVVQLNLLICMSVTYHLINRGYNLRVVWIIRTIPVNNFLTVIVCCT